MESICAYYDEILSTITASGVRAWESNGVLFDDVSGWEPCLSKAPKLISPKVHSGIDLTPEVNVH